MSCSLNNTQNKTYFPPIESYEVWKKDKINDIKKVIDKKINHTQKPTLIILEIGHFTLPKNTENIDWAKQNIDFVNTLISSLIKKYKKDVKFLATILVNNLDNEVNCDRDKILEELFKNKKYLPLKNIRILSERNLKNRAYKALKKNHILNESFIHLDGKAYLKDKEYKNDLAAGFVDDDGNIIPRCGLILTSFLDKVTSLSKSRMYPDIDYETIFISFSQEYHEYERMKLGFDIYTSTNKNIKITPIITHWGYDVDQCVIAHKDNFKTLWIEK